jgi:hypothetical protein
MSLRISKNKLNPEVKYIPINQHTKIYAFQGGSHYHLSKDCPMLNNGQFEKYGYKVISLIEIKTRLLKPCMCVQENGVEEFKRKLGLVIK